MTRNDQSPLLASIREENLNVYRASPGRLKEDVGQEAEIAHDYRDRLIHELLQNADDAMLEGATLDDRVTFRLTDEELWVGNNGRPLNDADVKGLSKVTFETIADDEEPQDGEEGSEPIDTDQDAESRTWETDDDDAEEGTLDDGPDDLASDETRHDRERYWGG